MNSDGGRCHDNARVGQVEELKTFVWRYFMSYWNRRRICSANGGLLPIVKRQSYFAALRAAA